MQKMKECLKITVVLLIFCIYKGRKDERNVIYPVKLNGLDGNELFFQFLTK